MAHCLGDANLLADLSKAEIVSAHRGEVSVSSREDMRERFASVFKATDYQHYIDLTPPRISVSRAGDVGSITVNVRAIGESVDGAPFDDQWAWIMLVEKVSGVWLHAGNASNKR